MPQMTSSEEVLYRFAFPTSKYITHLGSNIILQAIASTYYESASNRMITMVEEPATVERHSAC